MEVRKRRQSGFTLIELIVAVTILGIISGLAVPIVRVQIKRTKEIELHRDLWEMRDAIDRYKAAADRGAFRTKAGSENYPPDLQTLVDGVDINGKKLRFLRKVPTDPMTGNTEWGQRSVQDENLIASDNQETGGIVDVHSGATGTSTDGTAYNTW